MNCEHQIPAIGSKAPNFTAVTTNGVINFPEDYNGKWVVLFSHPADFTPICTSEIATFAAMYDDFKNLNCELIGLSIDSNSSHLAWIKNIQDKIRFGIYNGQKITFPLIADNKGDIALLYGMIHPELGDTKACRAVFFIDPQSVIRAIIYYPMSTGRNFEEIKRVIQALQTTDKYSVSTPANWKPGNDVLISAPQNSRELEQKQQNMVNENCNDWFFCTKPLSELQNKNSQ